LVWVALLICQFSFASDFSDHSWYGISAGGGYQSLSSSLNTDTPKSGYLLNFKLLGEYRSDSWGAFNLGVGGQETWQQGSTTSRLQQLTIGSILVDISYLYPILHLSSESVLWVGAAFNTHIGAGTLFDFTNLQSNQYFTEIGPHVRYNFDFNSWHCFAGAEFLYGLNSPSKTILTIPVYVGVMFRLGNEPKKEESQPQPIVTPTPAPLVEEKPVSAPVETPKVELKLDAKLVTFDVDKTTLKPASINFLEKVSQILVNQQDNWKAIQISGHTDGTGKPTHNRTLSEGRAKAVLDEFVKNGVPADRLTSEGYGSQKLIPGEPKNSEVHRRVELSFDGVLDSEKLQKALDSLKTKAIVKEED
jgi:outer membrane protein OmpA-like peptidoglycan-associated protein